MRPQHSILYWGLLCFLIKTFFAADAFLIFVQHIGDMILQDFNKFLGVVRKNSVFFGNQAQLSLQVFLNGDFYCAMDVLYIGLIFIRDIRHKGDAMIVDEFFFVDLLMFEDADLAGAWFMGQRIDEGDELLAAAGGKMEQRIFQRCFE